MGPDADERLRQLLRWKRWERPDAAFWEQFEATFQEKRLHVLAQGGWRNRLGRLLRAAVRPAFASAGLACAVTLLFLSPRTAGVLAEPREMEFLFLSQGGAMEAVEGELFDEGDGAVCYVSQAIPGTGTAVLSAYHF
jgi:hypothetical protein